MNASNRRDFLAEVGQGMTAVLLGPALACELGVASESKEEGKQKTTSALDRLAKQLQQARPEKLLGVYKKMLDDGSTLKQIVAAAALANAHAVGGQNYDGYHTFMALSPAFAMAQELPEKERPVPIFKVLVRNSEVITAERRNDFDCLTEPEHVELTEKPIERLLDLSRDGKVRDADALASAWHKQKPESAYDEVQPLVHDALNVHRVVLAWRAWEIIDFTGKEYARTMLRQTVRHCADYANHVGYSNPNFRNTLPKLLDTHRLLGKKLGTKKADDAWIEKLARIVYSDKPARAADAVGAALAEGIAPESITEAVSLAATMLVLGDRGRQVGNRPKPVGSVHGDSVGVHASDAANAWRHIATVTNARNTICSLLAAAYHTAGQSGRQMDKPYPLAADVEKIETNDEAKLLRALQESIDDKEQARACAVVAKYGKQGHDSRKVFAVLRKFAISEDGALHAEKYYHTVKEEFARSRPAFRWQHLMALARVTASANGRPAAGVAEARRLFVT